MSVVVGPLEKPPCQRDWCKPGADTVMLSVNKVIMNDALRIDVRESVSH